MLPFESDLYWQTLPLFVQKLHSQVKLLRQALIDNKVLIGFLKPNWNSDPSRKRMSWLILNLRSNIGTRWPNDLGPKLNCLYIFLCSLDDPRKSWQQRRAHQLFLSTNRCSLHSHSTNGKTRNERYEIWTLWMQLKYVKRIYFNIINLLYYPLYYFVSDWPRARFDPLLKTILLFSDCDAPLGSEDGRIANQEITASSYSSTSYGPWKARLHQNSGSWCSKYRNQKQWLQFDFGAVTVVKHIATQGYHTSTQYFVKSYSVSYGNNGFSFKYYQEGGRTKVRLDQRVMILFYIPICYAFPW